MFRSQTDGMLAAKFDPEPWLDRDGVMRFAERNEPCTFDPHPEFIPTLDPFPVEVVRKDGSTYRVTFPLGFYIRHWNTAETRTAIRPQFVRPEPNPILVNLRADVSAGADVIESAQEYLDEADGRFDNRSEDDFTSEQIEHARKVLTLLAALA